MGRCAASRPFVVFLAALFTLHFAGQPSARAAGPGQWTPAANWGADDSGNYAVHMILMAGDGSPYHSRLLWFRGHGGAGLKGGEWGWNPGNESCESYPGASFTALNPTDPVVDIFCSGHAGLSDGRIVLPGGTQPLSGNYGENASRLFTPGGGSAPGSWSDPGNLAERRLAQSVLGSDDDRVRRRQKGARARRGLRRARPARGDARGRYARHRAPYRRLGWRHRVRLARPGRGLPVSHDRGRV